jgi:hypothetical protein
VGDPVVDHASGALPAYGPDEAPIFVWPLSAGDAPDWTAGGFTPRWKVSEDRYDFHQGLDLVPRVTANGVETAADQDELLAHPPEVHAVTDGVVESLYPVGSSNFPSSGNVARLKHYIQGGSEAASNVYYTYYMHLADFCTDAGACLSEGQAVKRGDPIAHLGDSESIDGDLDFAHLHFEVRGHGWQFYAVNPFRYLPHAETDAYAPEILVGAELPDACARDADPRAPVFMVRAGADRDELDVDRVLVTLTDLDTGEVVDEDVVDFERREGLTYWHDIDGDDEIRVSGSWGEDDATTFEYDADALLGVAEPVFDTCGGEVRNVFRSTSDAYALEVLYTGMTGAGRLRVEAEVCDLDDTCVAAAPREL